MTKRKALGVLDPNFDWDALTPEERERIYFRNEPNAAYEMIVTLRRQADHYRAMVEELQNLCKQAAAGWRVSQETHNEVVERKMQLEQKLEAIERSRDALDQK